MGCDTHIEPSLLELQFQSTHPCGVRQHGKLLIFQPYEFQSTHPCGVRPASKRTNHPIFQFQSTHPCGVRRSAALSFSVLIRFNPRTRVGCDDVMGVSRIELNVSIHAPVWGATKPRNDPAFGLRFNPRTRVGCDIAMPFYPIEFKVSIHAPVWGATAYLVTDSYYS